MTNRPHSLPRAQRRLLSLHDHRLFADHDALELHRRNIIIDFQQKVRQIEALRDRIAAFPHRRTLNLHGRADSHRERQSQRVIAASSEGQRVGVSNLSISCLVAKEEPRGLTAFQKESMSRMRAKREMMSRKKASTHRTRPLGQGRLQTE